MAAGSKIRIKKVKYQGKVKHIWQLEVRGEVVARSVRTYAAPHLANTAAKSAKTQMERATITIDE